MKFKVKIIEIGKVAKDIYRIKTEKPAKYNFVPGQHCVIGLPDDKIKRSYSFSSVPSDDFLEFYVRVYAERNGFSRKVVDLKVGDELVISEAIGRRLEYNGEGVFIAGGVGVTPFISVLKELDLKGEIGKNVLWISNKTSEDIFYEKELKKILGENVKFILTREKIDDYESGRIDQEFLEKNVKDLDKMFYVCSSDSFTNCIKENLKALGVSEENIRGSV